jgi:hypothetical protein
MGHLMKQNRTGQGSRSISVIMIHMRKKDRDCLGEESCDWKHDRNFQIIEIKVPPKPAHSYQ